MSITRDIIESGGYTAKLWVLDLGPLSFCVSRDNYSGDNDWSATLRFGKLHFETGWWTS